MVKTCVKCKKDFDRVMGDHCDECADMSEEEQAETMKRIVELKKRGDKGGLRKLMGDIMARAKGMTNFYVLHCLRDIDEYMACKYKPVTYAHKIQVTGNPMIANNRKMWFCTRKKGEPCIYDKEKEVKKGCQGCCGDSEDGSCVCR